MIGTNETENRTDYWGCRCSGVMGCISSISMSDLPRQSLISDEQLWRRFSKGTGREAKGKWRNRDQTIQSHIFLMSMRSLSFLGEVTVKLVKTPLSSIASPRCIDPLKQPRLFDNIDTVVSVSGDVTACW